ncbi:ribosomal protein L4 domain-containing protein [Mycena latifolia]|nr:ribosomal protein L4 domain-containing protein [Mycena latifolia]
MLAGPFPLLPPNPACDTSVALTHPAGQHRFAVVSALAASALPSLVLARGHRIEQIEEVPLVVASAAESFTKTKEAVALLKSMNAYAAETPPAPRRPHKENNNIVKVFCNFPGVELVNVRRLNLLQLASGGHLGSFIIWTEGAFMLLDEVFGPSTRSSPNLYAKTICRPELSTVRLSARASARVLVQGVSPPTPSPPMPPWCPDSGALRGEGRRVHRLLQCTMLRKERTLGKKALRGARESCRPSRARKPQGQTS